MLIIPFLLFAFNPFWISVILHFICVALTVCSAKSLPLLKHTGNAQH